MLEIWGDAGDSFTKRLWNWGFLEFLEMGGGLLKMGGVVFEMGGGLNPSTNYEFNSTTRTSTVHIPS